MFQTSAPGGAINIKRFEQLLESYGANADRWPAGERDAALAFAQTSPDAQRLLDEAAQLDGMLDLAASPEPSAALAARIVAAVERAPAWRVWLSGIASELWPFEGQWRAAAILASSMFLGLALGAVIPPVSAGEDEVPFIEELALLAFGPKLTTEEQE